MLGVSSKYTNCSQSHQLTLYNRASVHGTRITLRQVSPESEDIYDFIVELHKSNDGNWSSAQKKAGISDEDLKFFLEYCGQVSYNKTTRTMLRI